jgi:hypothetical protein
VKVSVDGKESHVKALMLEMFLSGYKGDAEGLDAAFAIFRLELKANRDLTEALRAGRGKRVRFLLTSRPP